MNNEIMNNGNIKSLYKEIFEIIEKSKNSVITAVNSEMVILYWNIGRII